MSPTTRPQRSITIHDVARAAGVSKATASVALSSARSSSSTVRIAPETRLRILKTAQEMGYERNALAFALSQGRTYTVGLVAEGATMTTRSAATINAYSKDIIIAVTCACARAGLRMTTILTDSSGESAAAEVVDGRVDGAIFASLKDTTLAQEVFRRGFPAVTIGSGYSELRVAPDNRGGVRAAIDHLMELGHRRIAYVSYPNPQTDSWTTKERLSSYYAAMVVHGLDPLLYHDQELTEGFERVQPTACMCFNDVVAVGVLRWARQRGITVPDELSVIGFDNSVLATYSDPRLTTVENPLDAQADIAIALLQSRWRSEEIVAPPPIETRLVLRNTTATVPGGRS